ncbi:MAG TPA: hypothetical protein V6D26_10915 [Stenomitos sp.]
MPTLGLILSTYLENRRGDAATLQTPRNEFSYVLVYAVHDAYLVCQLEGDGFVVSDLGSKRHRQKE